PQSAFWCILLLLIGCIPWALGCCVYTIRSREYSLSPDGITIRYLKRYCRFYQWSIIKEISFCDVNHNKGQNFDKVIRIVAFDENKVSVPGWSLLQRHEYWRDYHYQMRNYALIILIDYSQELCDNIHELSGKTILDLRTTEWTDSEL
ncbi:MAG: PH domain-containing protein, partial [Oscillospiraceae bacterium]|nr:PH domain-containing protein [Oscillospiraceae bacterium]